MNMPDLMKASGLWEQPLNRDTLLVCRAFYNRPWVDHCSLDDAVVLSSKYGVDPYPLMKMLRAAGELVEFEEGS